MSGLTLTRSLLRQLVRAKNQAFKGDAEMQKVASDTIRREMDDQKYTLPEELPGRLQDMENAILFLKTNVVQAPLNQRGNYEVDASSVDETKRR